MKAHYGATDSWQSSGWTEWQTGACATRSRRRRSRVRVWLPGASASDGVIERRTDAYRPDAFPMDAALRLLLALSGGSDGRTFRFEDPMRVAQEVRSSLSR